MKKLPMKDVYKAQPAFTNLCYTPDSDDEQADFGFELYHVAMNELHSRTPRITVEALIQRLSLLGEEHVLKYLVLSLGFQMLVISVPSEVTTGLAEDIPHIERLIDDVKVASC